MDDDIHEMIATRVTIDVLEAVPEFFASIKIAMIDMFDDHSLTDTATVVLIIAVDVAGG